jgi:hypothetical protein
MFLRPCVMKLFIFMYIRLKRFPCVHASICSVALSCSHELLEGKF